MGDGSRAGGGSRAGDGSRGSDGRRSTNGKDRGRQRMEQGGYMRCNKCTQVTQSRALRMAWRLRSPRVMRVGNGRRQRSKVREGDVKQHGRAKNGSAVV